MYGLKYPHWVVIVVLTLLAYGCPIQAVVAAFGLDERTVSDWHERAGRHAKAVQERLVCQRQIEIGQVQGDEMYIKTQYGTVWLATAISVFSRLLIWGAVSPERNSLLITQVVEKVKESAVALQPILWATDGYSAWKGAILDVFREPLRTGKPGRPRLVIWPELHIVQVIKRRVAKQIVSVERRLAHGLQAAAEDILFASQSDIGRFNTAYVERLNATIRTWVRATTRRSRTPAARRRRLEAAFFWAAAVYNFCRIHESLQTAPAVAAGITDSPWSIDQLLRFRPALE